LFRQGRPSEALRHFTQALNCRPPDPAPIFADLGLAQAGLGQFEDALSSYDKALAARPNYAEALNNRGNAFRSLGRFEEALES
jgi:tetratricopeptide (TPR) repeat protein